MKFTRMRIVNFRSFGSDGVDIDFDGTLTAFVGDNGAGKTAVFSALARMFGTTNGVREMRPADFHVPPGGTLDEDTELLLDAYFGFDDGDDTVPDFIQQLTVAGVGEPILVRVRLKANWIDDGTPEGTVETSLRWVTSTDDTFDWDDCAPVRPRERALVQCIYVPASRNAHDQVAGLLKSRIWRAAKWSLKLQKAVGKSGAEVQEIFAEEEATKFFLERIRERWNDVATAGSYAEPELRVAEDDLVNLLRRAEFVMRREQDDRPLLLNELSDGQRSLFHLAIVAAMLEIEHEALSEDDAPFERESIKRVALTIFAIEEPENSLAPFYLSRIVGLLWRIGRMDSAQSLVSSHSASILGRVKPMAVRYVRRDTKSMVSDVRSIRLPQDDGEAERYVRLAVYAHPELYFARHVILGEGDSESLVIPRVAAAMGLPLDRRSVPIVPLGGRFVNHFWRLLDDLGIPHSTLLDLDAGRRHGGRRTIEYVLKELSAVGREVDESGLLLKHGLNVDALPDDLDQQLIDQDQGHPLVEALRDVGIFFSTPLDLDFAMLNLFPEAYKVPSGHGPGPAKDATKTESRRKRTLKKNGNGSLYDDEWDETFDWYPYLFIDGGKPGSHLSGLTRIKQSGLKKNAPLELRELIEHVRKSVDR